MVHFRFYKKLRRGPQEGITTVRIPTCEVSSWQNDYTLKLSTPLLELPTTVPLLIATVGPAARAWLDAVGTATT